MLDTTPAWREVLAQLGVDPGNAVAGFSGGVVNVLRMKLIRPSMVVGTTVSGMLIAIYLGEPLAKLINFPAVPTSFVIGYIGVQILEYFSSLLRQRLSGGSAATPNGGPKDASA